ncbi:MAG: hypothetical protein AAGA37_03185 [Actinomycetota bacterium]
MNRRLLIVPAVGVAALLGSQVLLGGGGDDDLPLPAPAFPAVASQGSAAAQDWTQDDWSVNRSVADPFAPWSSSSISESEDVPAALDGGVIDGSDLDEPDPQLDEDPTATTTPPAP